MGGCYESSTRYSPPINVWKTASEGSLRGFFAKGNIEDLIDAYKSYQNNNQNGFIKHLLEHRKVGMSPKEFPEIEYEIKFNIDVTGKGKEPELVEYLDAFDYPATKNARFLKDAINTVSVGENYFFGKDDEEVLVVISKGGKTYLKEKSQPLPLQTTVPYQEILIKRTEDRYEAPIEKVLAKLMELGKKDVEYKGVIRKEKGDYFMLDTWHGRIFSCTVTRAKMGENVQRQLELEYAGYIPGFKGHEFENETQLIETAVELAKTIAVLNGKTKIKSWMAELDITHQRKYDFVRSNGEPEEKPCFNLQKDLGRLIEGKK